MHPEARERLAGQRLRLRDLVLVVREDQVVAAGSGCRSVSPRYFIAIAEHSMCQPGRPGPIAVSHEGSPGFGAFHSAKSRALSLSYSSTSTRAPSSMPAKSFLRQLAVLGERRDAEIVRAVLGLVGVALRPPACWMNSTISLDVLGGARRSAPAARCSARPRPRGTPSCTSSVYSPMRHAACAALRMILSSTSVMFMTWRSL